LPLKSKIQQRRNLFISSPPEGRNRRTHFKNSLILYKKLKTMDKIKINTSIIREHITTEVYKIL
jgi:hypothetical protein